jgi:hypothetical protein
MAYVSGLRKLLAPLDDDCFGTFLLCKQYGNVKSGHQLIVYGKKNSAFENLPVTISNNLFYFVSFSSASTFFFSFIYMFGLIDELKSHPFPIVQPFHNQTSYFESCTPLPVSDIECAPIPILSTLHLLQIPGKSKKKRVLV